jgi:cell division protein FtsB
MAARSKQQPKVRWDRLGRIAMLLVLVALVYLYISPARSLLRAVHQSREQRAALVSLERQNFDLRARAASLQGSGALEQAARNLGLVLPGEHPYVVSDLPAD